MGWGQPVHLPEMQPDTEPGLAAESIHPAGRRENSGLPAGEPVGAGHPPVCFMKLQGNKVIITGCSRGLGVAVAEAMWREGADLLLVARSGAALCEVRDRLAGSATAQQAHAFPADLGDPAAPQAVLAEARRLWSRVDILLNSASSRLTGCVKQVSEGALSISLAVALPLRGRVSRRTRRPSAPSSGSVRRSRRKSPILESA